MDIDQIYSLIRDSYKDDVRFIENPAPRVMGDRLGYYSTTKTRPTIYIRADLAGIDRLVTLAHELGHHVSATKGLPREYSQAMAASDNDWRDRPLPEQRAVLEEELKAWQYGLSILQNNGYAADESVAAIACSQLEHYRSRLELPIGEFEKAQAWLRNSPVLH